jgi:putative selenate reductase
VTLSTFHGCPPEEIEQIVERLFDRHGMDVVLKLNPTLLGFATVEALLRGTLGYESLRLDRDDFHRDLQWADAVPMIERLSHAAARRGLGLGVKLTNTLIVRNDRGRLAGERVYLSGAPLHVLAITLAERLTEALADPPPLSFSAGIDAENFAATVACGFAPVTSCTDLLKPTGYRRLPRYLKALEAEMRRLSARTIDELIVATAREAGATPAGTREAGLANLARYAEAVRRDPRYRAEQHRTEPRREASHLSFFDCLGCNACVVVCPNDAMFSFATLPFAIDAPDLVAQDGRIVSEPRPFSIAAEEQWAVFADVCNACGNCDTFCPEQGGPFRAKPRFFGTKEAFEAEAPEDGVVVLENGRHILARFAGVAYEISETAAGTRFSDGTIEALLDAEHRVLSAASIGKSGEHRLALHRYHAMRVLRDAALARVNPVSAPFTLARLARR